MFVWSVEYMILAVHDGKQFCHIGWLCLAETVQRLCRSLWMQQQCDAANRGIQAAIGVWISGGNTSSCMVRKQQSMMMLTVVLFWGRSQESIHGIKLILAS